MGRNPSYLRAEVRRLRKMLEAMAQAGHYDMGCDCDGCEAHREVYGWITARERRAERAKAKTRTP